MSSLQRFVAIAALFPTALGALALQLSPIRLQRTSDRPAEQSAAAIRAQEPQQPRVRVAVVVANGSLSAATDIKRALSRAPEVSELEFFNAGAVKASLPPDSAWRGYDVVLVDAADDSTGVLRSPVSIASRQTRVVVVNGTRVEGSVAASAHPWIAEYWRNASQENYGRLLRYLATRVTERGTATPVGPPVIYPVMSFYHPGSPELFRTYDDYRAWYEGPRGTRHRFDATAPSVGILFNRGVFTRGTQQAIDSLIASFERRGANVFAVPADGSANFAAFFQRGGAPIIDVLIFQGERLHLKSYEQGLKEARSLGVPILSALVHYRQSPAQIRAAANTIAPDLTGFLVNEERDGVFEPLVIAGRSADSALAGLPETLTETIEWRVERALSWAKLRRASNASKRVAMTYWSEGAGKADVGGDPDDFLDVPASIERLLVAMKARGYDVGAAPLPDRAELARRMSRDASNVGSYAPGELATRVARGQVALIPESTYVRWFNVLPRERRSEIEAMWGPPPGKVMMHVAADGARSIVIPRLQFGNVLVAPHPAWGYQMDDKVLMTAGAIPPHHQYLAFFLWLQKSWKADAWVPLFSNIVLQPGRAEGPMPDDQIGLLLGALPHIHPERLGASGGISNIRKGLAQLVSWYNLVAPADAGDRIGDLRARVLRRAALADTGLIRQAEAGIQSMLDSLALREALDISARTPFDTISRRVLRYAERLEREQMPYGAKVLGDAPIDTVRADMIQGMLGVELTRALAQSSDPTRNARTLVRERMRGAAAVSVGNRAADSLLALIPEYGGRLAKAPREIDGVLETLEGRYIEPGPMEEPARRPDAVPPGRTMYTFDPRAIPTPEAEALGKRMADAMIQAHRDKNGGAWPTRFAFVLWAGEVTKNYGVSESQILHLLGVRPVRNPRGDVVDIALIPREELGRPRIDVLAVPSGVYRDHFEDKIELITRAVKLAESSPEADNAVSRTTRAALAGVDSTRADIAQVRALASARVFTSAPNAYGPSISFLAKSGDARGDEKQMADLFSRQMSYAYGGGLTGTSARGTFEKQLTTLDAASLSRSSSVNGLLDNPSPASFLGGIDLATRAVRGGRGAALFVTSVVDTSAARVLTAREALKTELDTRYFNPKWIKEMKDNGYDGARNMMFMTDHLELWDATSPDAVTSEDWDKVKSVYVADDLGLGLDEFFDKNNPFAQQVVLSNLMGAAQRGMWRASEADLVQVASRLVKSVADHGNSCDAALCKNAALTAMLEKTLASVPGAQAQLAQFRATIAAARAPVNALAAAPVVAPPAPAPSAPATSAPAPSVVAPASPIAPPSATVVAAPSPAPSSPPPPAADASKSAARDASTSTTVTGRVMEEQTQETAPAVAPAVSRALLGALLVVVVLLVSGWWREGRSLKS
jgi:cobaltochelatase CobN